LHTLLNGALPRVTLDAPARHPLKWRVLNAAWLLLAAGIRERGALEGGLEI
jgi:hypothetical protein